MPKATRQWQKEVDQVMLIDAFATRYGWDYWTIERQPVWVIDLLPVVWSVQRELGDA